MNAAPKPVLPAVPLLPIDDACVAEARRALVCDGTLADEDDGALVLRWLLIARALPVALDALAAASDELAAARLGVPQVEGAFEPSTSALAAVARVDEQLRTIEVRIAGGPVSDELVESDAPVLSRVVFPFAVGGEQADDGDVRIQRFGYGPGQRR